MISAADRIASVRASSFDFAAFMPHRFEEDGSRPYGNSKPRPFYRLHTMTNFFRAATLEDCSNIMSAKSMGCDPQFGGQTPLLALGLQKEWRQYHGTSIRASKLRRIENSSPDVEQAQNSPTAEWNRHRTIGSLQ